MSKFTPLVKREYKFEDETVVVRFRRLKMKHMLKILPAARKLEKLGEDDDNQDDRLEVVGELLEKVGGFIGEYIEEIIGVTDANNEAVSKDTILQETYFMELMISILTDMVLESLGPSGKQ